MRILIAPIVAMLLCITPFVAAISTEDAPTIENSFKQYIDNGKIEGINVTIKSTNGIIYNITAKSANDILNARLIGITEFANLTSYHPEVTKAWITISLINHIDSYKPLFLDVYANDLSSISDKKAVSSSIALQVFNLIMGKRGTTSTIEDRSASTISSTKSYSNSYSNTASYKSTTSDYSGSSSKSCTPIQVKGYYRKDGTYVRPHTRMPPGCG